METRKFTDGAGIEWTVCCVTPPVGGGAANDDTAECPAGWLCFDSRIERRRLSEFPTDWSALRPEEMRALLRRAEVTPRRRLDESTAEFTRRQDHVFSHQPPPSDGSRVFCTPDNQIWAVRECEGAGECEGEDVGGRTAHVLRFVSGETVRELARYPDDWDRLTTEQLITLALDARPVTHRPKERERDATHGAGESTERGRADTRGA